MTGTPLKIHRTDTASASAFAVAAAQRAQPVGVVPQSGWGYVAAKGQNDCSFAILADVMRPLSGAPARAAFGDLFVEFFFFFFFCFCFFLSLKGSVSRRHLRGQQFVSSPLPSPLRPRLVYYSTATMAECPRGGRR